MRKRTIRFGDYTFFGSELRQSDSIEAVLIPRLEREHGPHHRLVHEARRHAEQMREAEMEKRARAMRMVDLSWLREVAKVQADRDRLDSLDPPPPDQGGPRAVGGRCATSPVAKHEQVDEAVRLLDERFHDAQQDGPNAYGVFLAELDDEDDRARLRQEAVATVREFLAGFRDTE